MCGFRLGFIIIGDYYLSPRISLYVRMYRVLIAENYVQRFGHSSQVFLAGDLNMRFGVQESDTTTNLRVPISVTSCRICLRRLEPRVEDSTLLLDVAQGGFRQDRSSSYLIFTLDSTQKE